VELKKGPTFTPKYGNKGKGKAGNKRNQTQKKQE
jgi:hypothetical protein